MTREEANAYYKENDWCVYKYNPSSKDLINELFKFVDKHPGITYLSYYKDDNRTGELFDMDNLIFYLYYHQRNIELYDEISNNDILSNSWFDSDSYTLDSGYVEKLKEDTILMREIVSQLYDIHNKFERLFGK